MAFLVLLFVAQLMNTIESSCIQKEFSENPIEVQDSCSRENLENRWRGELSYTWKETYIEVQWKKIVQDWTCVKNMEFFVDGVRDESIWGMQNEIVRINMIGEFSLKVEVYFVMPGTPGTCYGVPSACRCFEATIDLNIHENNEDNQDNEGNEGNGGNGDIDAGESTLPIYVAAASGGVILFFALLLTLAICCVKQRRKQRRRLEKAEEEEMTANTDENNVYGVYATTNAETDYIVVTDNNPNYES